MGSMQTISMAGPSDMGGVVGFGSLGGLGGMGGIFSLLNLGIGRSGVQLPSLEDGGSADLLLEAAEEAAEILLDLQEGM